MPPANSRATSPPEDPAQRSNTPPSYLSALRELESPVSSSVLNLAATLTTQGEEDADAENLDFLRSAIEPTNTWEQQTLSDRLRRTSMDRVVVDDRERRERLRRVMNRLNNRMHDNDPPAYGDRIPSQNNLYDWSPSAANEADDEEELDHILQELRQQQPHTHPDILRVLGRSQLDAERESRNRAYSSRLPSPYQSAQPPEPSLRSTAILQSVRRHPRFSARTRNYIERYISDRESAIRSTHDSGSRERASPPRAANSPFERGRYEASRQAWQAQQLLQRNAERQGNRDETRQNADRDINRDISNRLNSYRRNYGENKPPSSTPDVLPWLEHTIKYLSRIRDSTSFSESLFHAVDASFTSRESFGDDPDDFVMDINTLPSPAESSWLAPGAILSGSQHATNITSTVTRDTGSGSGLSLTSINATQGGQFLYTILRNAETGDNSSGSRWASSLNRSHRQNSRSMPSGGETVTTHSPQQDRWPVKVTIHAVDWENMSLSATMEAYNVPSHPQPYQSILSSSFDPTAHTPRTSSITTYLEGEILDFRNHTFLTESFKSTAANDAIYWRKLPPFQKFTDEELVKKLVSRRWLTEELSRNWILMRWKERCFVKSFKPASSTTSSFPTPSSSSFPVQNPTTATPTHNLSFSSTSSSRENHYHFPAGVPESEVGQFDDSGCGLTISGFYYVALRRSDGMLEGLYHDPQSSPYQHLRLESVRGGVCGVWGFR